GRSRSTHATNPQLIKPHAPDRRRCFSLAVHVSAIRRYRTGANIAFCTYGWYIDPNRELPRDRELSGRVAAGLLRRGLAVAAHSIGSRKPTLPQASDDRRRDDRPGLAGAAQQSL